jgi:hypothetical protein
MMFLIAAIQALLLFRFTIASPFPQADPTRTNPCPYSLFATIATRSNYTYPQVTWTAAPNNTIRYPLSFAVNTTPAPTPANCMIVQGAPFCLSVAANALANSLWRSLGTSAIASAVCPTPPWNTVGVTAIGKSSFLFLDLDLDLIYSRSYIYSFCISSKHELICRSYLGV